MGKDEGRVTPLNPETIAKRTVQIRNTKVMLDHDLAEIYGVSTKRLNEQVSRIIDRFPDDFMFRLTATEGAHLRSQNATSSWGGRRHTPRVFTEHGAAMQASVLRSKTAIQTSILVVRGFIRLREWMVAHEDLLHKLEELEKKYDQNFSMVFDAIRSLMARDKKPTRRIGFEYPAA